MVCIRQFVTSSSNKFIKNHTYVRVGNTLDIVASSILYTYDVDNTQNSILKMPWFFTLQPLVFNKTDMTPWAIFQSKNWQWQNHYSFIAALFCPFIAWNTDQTQHQGKCQYRQHMESILYTQRWGFRWSLNNKKILCNENHLYNPNPKIVFMNV